MDITRISCSGMQIGAVQIPPFQLRDGELICLHMPSPALSDLEKQIIDLLTGKRSGLQVSAQVTWIDPPSWTKGLLGLFYQPRAVAWLRRVARISPQEALSIVERLGLRREWRVSQLSWDERSLLGLEAAWANRAETIVFSTVGCSFLGRRAIYEAVLSHIDQCPAIHLSYAYWTQGRQERFCHPKARCLEVSQAQSPIAATKSA
jgi:hypothetical protein